MLRSEFSIHTSARVEYQLLRSSCFDGSVNVILRQVVADIPWNLSPFGILLRSMYEKQASVAHAVSMQVKIEQDRVSVMS